MSIISSQEREEHVVSREATISSNRRGKCWMANREVRWRTWVMGENKSIDIDVSLSVAKECRRETLKMQPTGNRPVYIIQQNPSVRPVTSLQQPRFVTSPQQIFATNISPQNVTRLPTVTMTRPMFQNIVSQQTTVPSPSAPAATTAPGAKEYAVRVPR